MVQNEGLHIQLYYQGTLLYILEEQAGDWCMSRVDTVFGVGDVGRVVLCGWCGWCD